MPKDTKSLGNNKAPACESRGFVHKKEGVHFDTPSHDSGWHFEDTIIMGFRMYETFFTCLRRCTQRLYVSDICGLIFDNRVIELYV